MVLILHGLNQLQGTALSLKWIPDVISPSIRLVLSSTVEGTLVELKKRGWQQFGMQALSEPERETIVVRYLAEYHKSFNPEQIKRIASDYKCGHPLFLKTVLEELRLVGHHERRAVEKRYLSDEAKQRTIHLQIAEYFQSGVTASIAGGGAVPPRMASELAYQLHAAGAMDRLRECLSSMPVFLRLYDGPTVYEVLGYWTGMDAGTDIAGSYRPRLC